MAKFSFINKNIVNILKDLANGLRKLTFGDNFDSFEVNATITANTEYKIRNQLTTIPNYVIIDAKGNALVTRGDTDWSLNYVYLKNHDSTNSSTVKAIFFK